jgi:hypothetical protein
MIVQDSHRDGYGGSAAGADYVATAGAHGGTSVRTFLTAALWCLLAAYVVVLARYSPLTIQDLPNHLARGLVMADLMFHQGVMFGGSFQYHFLFVPYVLGDLALAGLVDVFGVTHAAAIWAILAFVSLPLALLVYLRALRVEPEYRALLLLLSLYLAADRFFVLGFLAFRLGIAGLLVALALVESLRRRWSTWRYLLLIVVTVALYLIHLAPIAFLGTALAATAAVRLYRHTTYPGRELGFLLPVLAVLAWQFLVVTGYRQPQDSVAYPFSWGTPLHKLTALTWDLYRFVPRRDAFMAILAAGSVLWVSIRSRKVLSTSDAILETGALVSGFLVIYMIMPDQYGEASLIDVRVCAALILFVVVGCVRTLEPAPRRSPVLWAAGGLAALVVLINLAYLGKHLGENEVWMSRYRALLTAIPQHSRVLPVYTRHTQGGIHPFLHAQAFVVIDRAGLVPYLFSADLGDPMRYFRYLHRPYAPEEEWYNARDPVLAGVDWKQVADQYQYLVVMKPFDPARLPLASRIVAENEVATVLAVNRPAL